MLYVAPTGQIQQLDQNSFINALLQAAEVHALNLEKSSQARYSQAAIWANLVREARASDQSFDIRRRQMNMATMEYLNKLRSAIPQNKEIIAKRMKEADYTPEEITEALDYFERVAGNALIYYGKRIQQQKEE